MIPLIATGVSALGDDGKIILQIPQLSIKPGARVGICGPSGAGKTTLLHLLTGLIRPASGTITWGKTDITKLNEYQRDAFRLQHFGLVFQDILLFEELSALANASVSAAFSPRSLRKDIEKKAMETLDRLGIACGAIRKVESLSGGERQRVAVARALARNPQVIVADEPTAALDRENADKLIQDLLTIADQDGKILLMVSHDQKVLDAMDWIIHVVDGMVPTENYSLKVSYE